MAISTAVTEGKERNVSCTFSSYPTKEIYVLQINPDII